MKIYLNNTNYINNLKYIYIYILKIGNNGNGENQTN